jgi:GNAT superfamily N-acetyltransferase
LAVWSVHELAQNRCAYGQSCEENTMDAEIEVVQGYRPGAIGRVVELHARYYSQHWGFGRYFEAVVAHDLAALVQRDGPLDQIWLALRGEIIIGAVALDGSRAADLGVRLRFFILDEAAQGRGVGRQLLAKVLAFCQAQSVGQVYLTTFAGLEPARRLYEQAGFVLRDEHEDRTWGIPMREQTFVWRAVAH